MSMRLDILQCIARDIVAIDDIIAEIGGDAKKVRNNLQAARTDKLIASYADDVTKRPAYKLTDAGREWLKENAPQATPSPKPKAQADASTEDGMLREQVNLLRGVRDELIRQYQELKAAHDAAEMALSAAHQALADAGVPPGHIESRVAALIETLEEHKQALAAQRADAGVDVKDAARGYLVRAPKRRPRILMKPDSAVAAAMAAARNGSGRGDVYALVPVGSARRGAEWVDAQ